MNTGCCKNPEDGIGNLGDQVRDYVTRTVIWVLKHGKEDMGRKIVPGKRKNTCILKKKIRSV